MTTLALGPSWLDPDYLLNQFGLWGLLLIVFAESGLLIGFFLPGDSLLFTTGLLITTNKLDTPLWLACVLICIAAILGDQAGYLFGKKVGPSLFNRPDSKLFKQENVVKAHEFFEKHGPKSLVLARFVPIVRTFTPIIAGVSGMRYRSFITFNILGGILWGAGVTLLGAWLGKHEFVHKNIEAILILIVLISVVPIIIEFLRARSKSKKAGAQAPAAQQDAPDDHDDFGGHGDGSQQHRQAQLSPYPQQGQYPGQQGGQYGGGADGHHYQAQQPQYGDHQTQFLGRQQPQQAQQQGYDGGHPEQHQYQAQQPQYGDQQQGYVNQHAQNAQHQQHEGQYGNQYGNQYEGQQGGQYGNADGQQYQAPYDPAAQQYDGQQPQQQPYPDHQTQYLGRQQPQQPPYPEEPQQPGNPRY
ncbi:DedA family protein [Streptomyces flavofungini]|uniref:VTT domain-containing protein n=1 Tax=Streptomyces flavofungini TaxID=68200 RepID=A0ABS0XGP6_9ACTN|nr:VTT domain-containing protein [Streptomyces flavofungini]MBJ3812394.1 VTT domain-containing protein [Streptomyces flavofungini]GHC73395.1 membrane protein [Streptomyces flavofungini]